MLPLLLAALLGLAALVVVLAPLFTTTIAPAATDSDAQILAERERDAKAALHDVDFDYQLGNLADDDYRGLRERYVRRALTALKGRYDHEKALDDAIEAQVRALRARDTAATGDRSHPSNTSGGGALASQRPAANGHAPRRDRPNKHGGSGKNGRRPT